MENALGLDKTLGDVLGVAMFAIMLGLARILYAKFGKNIVRVVLESWGFDVTALGRDVSSDSVLRALSHKHYDLVGLSALMTTTLPAMEETVSAIRSNYPSVKIMVGGAVLTEEYAMKIGADFYGADAPSAAKIANAVADNKA